MNTNPRFSVQPPAGRPLPERWRAMAPQRAKDANASYLDALHNAWKGSNTIGSSRANIMRDARLKPPSWEDILGKK